MDGRKKLLTLAGVVGILACGACFLPPLPQHKPAPPPIRNGLDGVQNIRVEVVNASSSRHLVPAVLAQKIVETINEQSWKTKVDAHVGLEPRSEDATLVITVLSETVEPTAKAGHMRFNIEDSATLMRPDGALVWKETETANWITYNVDGEKEADAWKMLGGGSVDKELSEKLVFRMFFGR
jgi:hypothetical protein